MELLEIGVPFYIMPTNVRVSTSSIMTTIPSIVCDDNTIIVAASYDGYNDHHINTAPFMVDAHCRAIIEKEMAYFRKMEPDVDIQKLQDMINSKEKEMVDLAYSILGKHCRYIEKIHRCPDHSLHIIVSEYCSLNKYNITDKVL